MIFAAPWVLLALAALPLLWWLLRITPPAPRTEVFPAIRLLLGLRATEETPAHTPWWLLALRLAAAALLIVGLARPILDAGASLAGPGPVLLVVDDGWAAAVDWPARMQAADGVLDRAARAGRKVALLTTAPDPTGAAPSATVAMPVADARAKLGALRPLPWPVDRRAAAAALGRWHDGGSVVYLADGLTDGAGWPEFAAALAAVGPVVELRAPIAPARLLLPPRAEADRLVVRLAQVPRPVEDRATVLAQTGDGRTLGRVELRFAPGEALAEAPLLLPPELRNRLTRLVVAGSASAGGVALLDERWRRRPVGLLAGDETTADLPLSGPLYFIRRALAPYAELREGSLDQLLARKLSVLVLADRVVAPGPEQEAIDKWVKAGGLLLRFAGPLVAAHPDALLPVDLLGGDRELGGALSWSKPAELAPFAANSPFAGLAVPAEVRVHRQVLAKPDAQLAGHTWARLTDGTPLVTEAVHGAGRIVLFHITANADWSDLPLSGLFVEMLRRMVDLSVGVSGTEDAPDVRLAPVETLDGFGQAGAPPPVAAALTVAELARAIPSPTHPPGLYGPESGRRVLNLATHLAAPAASVPIAGARLEVLGEAPPERALGPWLVAAGLLLLAADLVVSLGLRGLLRASVAASLVLALAIAPAHAQMGAQGGVPLNPETNPALVTRLAWLVTGDASLDSVAKAGLQGLSDYVNQRTAAALGPPAPVVPGRDDLSFYPLIYWPISADQEPLSGAAVAALNDFMAHGGIIVIDTRDGGSGTGFAPGASAALPRIAARLAIPPLAPLTTEHVLAHSFYLLQDFPGRYVGATVWVQRDQDRSNDSVSPVIIAGNDWAAAWAVDADGRHPYAVIPGGERQRTFAYRFGVNLVMYALTGNYKGDQVHVPAILERLGQ